MVRGAFMCEVAPIRWTFFDLGQLKRFSPALTQPLFSHPPKLLINITSVDAKNLVIQRVEDWAPTRKTTKAKFIDDVQVTTDSLTGRAGLKLAPFSVEQPGWITARPVQGQWPFLGDHRRTETLEVHHPLHLVLSTFAFQLG